jgi:hypothetical protein
MIGRRPFTPEEDARLMQILTTVPFVSWDTVAQQFTERTARQCRERWLNYLCPQVRIGPWSSEEDSLLISLLNEHGRSWSVIRRKFNGRSENDIKNRWYSHLQFETIVEGSRVVLARNHPLMVGRPERQKRRRPLCDPKGTALRLLEQQLSRSSVASSPDCVEKEESAADSNIRVEVDGCFVGGDEWAWACSPDREGTCGCVNGWSGDMERFEDLGLWDSF